MIRRLLVGVSFLAAVLVAVPVTTVAVPSAPVAAAAATGCIPGSEFQLRDMVNQVRAANGLAPLPLASELDNRAQAWADTMVRENVLHHSNKNAAGVVVRSLAYGVTNGWQAVGENVGYHSSGLAAVEAALEASPGHRANLLGDYTEMGLGISKGPDGRVWVAQVFVKRPTPTNLVNTNAFTPVTPSQVFESNGLTPPATVTTVQITGKGGVPAGATAAVITIEATGSDGPGFVQALGPGAVIGATSNLNLVGGQIENTAVVGLSAAGQLRLYNWPPVHLNVFVVGYYTATAGAVSAGRFIALTPERLLDTRPESVVAYDGPQPVAGQTVSVQVNGRGGVPTSGVRAVVLDVVAVRTLGEGSVQVGPSGMPKGNSRNVLTSRTNQTIANLVIVPVGRDGKVELYTTVGTDLVVDVQGWFTDSSAPPALAGLFVPTPSARFMDTRGTPNAAGLKVVDLALHGDQPACPSAVLGNLTVNPSSLGVYAQAGPYGEFANGAFSSLNGQLASKAVANAALIATGVNSAVGIYLSTPAYLVVDLSGWFV